MTTLERQILPELRLNQQGVDDLFPPERRETWYGWRWPEDRFTTWRREPYFAKMGFGAATLECVVILPEIMIGAAADIAWDIECALNRHATRHVSGVDQGNG
jgi:hypothetical protein